MEKRGRFTAKASVLLCLLSIFIAFSFVLASPSENTKVFEKGGLEYGKISVFNAQNEKLAEYTLLKNTNQCLIHCYAEGTATIYTQGYLFDDLKFRERNSELRDIDSKILIETEKSYQVIINDYGEVCRDRIDNGTLKEFCSQEVIGTHQETRYKNIWEEYNSALLNPGNYKWRIEGEKRIYDNIDWIVSSFGESFTEWAWWDSAWDKRKNVNITGGNLLLDNFTILLNITYDSDMQGYFDDLRFVNGSCSGAQDTELSYEFDKKK